MNPTAPRSRIRSRPLGALAVVGLFLMSVLPTGAAAVDTPQDPLHVYDEVTARAGLQTLPRESLPATDVDAHGRFTHEVLALYDLVGAVPSEQALTKLGRDVSALPADVAAPVADLLAAMNEAARLRHLAFAEVSVDDARFAHAKTISVMPLTAEDEARLAEIHGRIDQDLMATAGRIVLEATSEARAALGPYAATRAAANVSFVDPLGSIHIAGPGDDVHVEDRTLLIDLGGDDDWQNNAGSVFPDFIIEAFPGCITTGGLDCSPLSAKRNAPAIESIMGRPCSADAAEAAFVAYQNAHDLDAQVQEQVARPNPFGFLFWAAEESPGWTGETVQTTDPQTDCLPQGAGDVEPWMDDFVTRGILTDGDEHIVAVGLDLGGNDRFAPPKEFNNINNGHNGAGCDTRDMGEDGKIWARNLTAAGAFAGVGVLWDDEGNDFYGGRSLTQGTGHVGGVGVLVDAGVGADVYESVRLAQGAAIFAALGLQYDEAGDDQYLMINDVPFFNEFEHFIGCDVSTRDGQGRANFNAVAALVDLAGDDLYFVQQHDEDVPGASRDDPTTTQGSTGTRLNIGPSPVNGLAALGLGLLWDRAGTDSYSRPGRADGVTDTSGVFIDE